MHNKMAQGTRARLRMWPMLALLTALAAHAPWQRAPDAAEAEPIELVDAWIRPAGRAQTSTSAIPLRLEVARSQKAWERGLMFRDTLPDNGGMLFLFPRADYHGIWMRGMEMPIDVLFVSAGHEIVSIRGHLPPCWTRRCRVYPPPEPVQYVLELQAGFVDRHLIRAGDRLEWDTGPESLVR